MSCAGGGVLTMQSRVRRSAIASPQASAFSVLGFSAPSGIGAVARGCNSQSLIESIGRVGFTSAAAINNVAGVRTNQVLTPVGILAGSIGQARVKGGGFRAVFVAGIADAVFNNEGRMFMGLRNTSAAPTSVDPATLNDSIGFGCNSNDTGLTFYARDLATSQNVALGAANFPVSNTAYSNLTRGYENLWKMLIECPQGQTANPTVFNWQIECLYTGVRASGQATLGIRFDQTLAFQIWRATGGVSTVATSLDVARFELETLE